MLVVSGVSCAQDLPNTQCSTFFTQ